MNTYSTLSQQSRVWIYQANRVLTNSEVDFIIKKTSDFVANWTAHNRPLKAFAEVRENLFILFYVDESDSIISGCGIDKSVHLVEEIGHELKIDFFDRMKVVYITDNKINISSLAEIKTLYSEKIINDTTMVFNTIVQTKKELESSFKIPLAKSWIIKRIASTDKIVTN